MSGNSLVEFKDVPLAKLNAQYSKILPESTQGNPPRWTKHLQVPVSQLAHLVSTFVMSQR